MKYEEQLSLWESLRGKTNFILSIMFVLSASAVEINILFVSILGLAAANFDKLFCGCSLKKSLYTIGILIMFILGGPLSVLDANEVESKSVAVTLKFDVYHSTKGKRSSFNWNGQGRKKITIKMKELGVSGVDSRRIVVREKNQDGKIGKLVEFSVTGEVTIKVPEQDTSYDIFLMNSVNKVNYSCLDQKKIEMVNKKRFIKVIRRDFGQAGSDRILKNIFKQINGALNPFGIKYGYLYYNRSFTEGDMSAGYGDLGEKSIIQQPWLGTHWPNGFVINSKKIGTEYLKALRAVGLEEAFEVYFGVDDICGRESGFMIQFGGELTPKGKDIIAYYALISPAE